METRKLIATKGVTLVALILFSFSLMPSALTQADESTCYGSCSEASTKQCCSQEERGCCQPTDPEEMSTFHDVTVDPDEDEINISIKPWNPPNTGCTSCTDDPSQCSIDLSNVDVSILEQTETRTVTQLIYEVDGSTFEMTVVRTLLWSYTELTDEIDRSARIVSIEITIEDIYTQLYGLNYLVQHRNYNLTIDTFLTSLNSETYNSSFTVINYTPADKSQVLSMEFVEFNSSVMLSEQYTVLGKIAKIVGQIYKNSGDENLVQLAPSYYTMNKEVKNLARLVRTQLSGYDREVLHSSGILMDPGWLDCLICSALCIGLIGIFVGCAIFTGPGFIACLAGALGMSWEAVLASIMTGFGLIYCCVVFCCCLSHDGCCDAIE